MKERKKKSVKFKRKKKRKKEEKSECSKNLNEVKSMLLYEDSLFKLVDLFSR